MDKIIKYTIQGVVKIKPEDWSPIEEIMGKFREYGTSEVTDVELIEEEE